MKYVDYSNYKHFIRYSGEDENYAYEDYDDFFDDFKLAMNTKCGVLVPQYTSAQLLSFITYISFVILCQFRRDNIAYDGKYHFMDRLTNDFSYKMLYLKQKYEMNNKILTETINKLRETGGMDSESNEHGTNGSNMVQKSASTPTGINPTPASSTQSILFQDYPSGKGMSADSSDYVDKYTNFVGKSSGLQDNNVDREGHISRFGSYADFLELMNKLPQDFNDEILGIANKHFIFDYDE